MDSDNSIQFLDHPTKGPSTVFAFFFLVSGGFHIWQSRRYESWHSTWPLPCACILSAGAFICREVQAFHPQDDMASAVQGLFYSAAPTFALPLYVYLLRLLYATTALATVSPWVVYLVISSFNSAIITCLSQGAATYFNPNATPGAVSSGLALIKASLFLQLILNAAFIAMVVQLLSTRRMGTKVMMLVSFIAMMVLMLVRNIFRTVQIYARPDAGVWMDEAYFWVFEACTMLLFTVSFHLLHPGKYAPWAGCAGGGVGMEDRRNSHSS